MSPRLNNPNHRLQSGFTLIEALIATLVLSIWLFGLASLQGLSLRMSQGAYLRSQAVNLTYEIVDAMRANQINAATYAAPDTYPAITCDMSYIRTNTSDIVQDDINEWRNRIACLLPQGEAAISQAGNQFTVTLCWNETHYEEAEDDPDCQDLDLEGTMHFTFTTEL